MTLYRPKLGVGVKTLIALSLVFWVPVSVLIFLLYNMFQDMVYSEATTRARIQLEGAQSTFEERERLVQGLLSSLASDEHIQQAVASGDIPYLQQVLIRTGQQNNFLSVLAVVDKTQRVVARRSDRRGDVLMGDALSSALLSGNPQISTELVSRDFLMREDGELTNLIKDIGLVKFIHVPVRNNERVVGALVAGMLITADPWLGNTVYGRFGVELAFFAGNPRETLYLHTTTSLPRSVWSLGQVMPAEVNSEIALGKPFLGMLRMGDQELVAAFQPVRDARNRVIGALGVSTPYTEFGAEVAVILAKGVGATAVIGLALALLSVFFVHHDITRPLTLLLEAMKRFGDGELGTHIELKTGDQLEKLGNGFNTMADGIRRREERFRKHNEVAKLFMSTMDMDVLLDKTLRIVVSVTDSQLGVLYLWEEDKQQLIPHAQYGTSAQLLPAAMGEGFPGRAAKDRTRLLLLPSEGTGDDVSIDMGFMKSVPKEVVYIPLVFQEDILGVLVLGSAHRYRDDEAQLFDYLADQISLALENARMHQRIQELSITDGLTGLYNRRFLNTRLEQEWARSQRQKLPISVILSDIDNFKSINDTYGHDKGDAVIREVAAIFKNNARKEDLVARYGGEEFVVVLVNATHEQALAMAQRIGEAARAREYSWMDRPATLSIGVVTYPDCYFERAEGLVHAADKAMYEAKVSGKDRVVVYSEKLVKAHAGNN